MTATVTTAEAISGTIALFIIVVAVLTIVRVILRREGLAWARVRIGVFVERDRSTHERDPDEYDWESPPSKPDDD